MRLEQPAQLHWVGQHAQLLPTTGCSACATPCSVGAGSVQASNGAKPTAVLSTAIQTNALAAGLPSAVSVAVDSGALNRYSALVFGLPLVALFALAALAGPSQISTPAQVPLVLLVVAAMLLIVTVVCRTVAQHFESQLQLEISNQKPHKLR